MSASGAAAHNFDEEREGQRFTIQPYQFEPRVNSDEAVRDNESMSGEEAMGSEEENINPRLENSDWYVAVIAIDQCILLFLLSTERLVDDK